MSVTRNMPEGRSCPKFVGRRRLLERLAQAVGAGVPAWVLVAEPGMGKSAFLNQACQLYPDSPFVHVRRPLGTHTAEGFWSSLWAQLDMGDSVKPESAHEAARKVALHLPLSPDQKRLVLVDSIERASGLLDSAGFAGLDGNIPGVTVVIAARPGSHLDTLAAGGAEIVWLKADDPDNLADLQEWLQLRLQGRSQEVIDSVLHASGGNFLVAGHLAQALDTGELQPHGLEDGTPKALESCLSAIWEEILDYAPVDIHDDIVKVACVICEAGEPLPTVSIADFLGYSAGRVRRVLKWLRPVLRADEQGYTFFDKRMNHLVARRFRRDLVQVHERIITFFRESYPSWDEMNDRYGWFYLAYHCDRLARTARRRDFSSLHWLGEGPYIKAKLEKTQSLSAVLQDLKRCLRAALEERNLPRIVGYGLRIPRLRAREAARGLHDLADLGQFELALDRARLLKNESSRFKALLLLAWQALDEGRPELCRRIAGLAGKVIFPGMVEEDRLLYAYIFCDLLQILSVEEILPLVFAGSDRERNLSIALRVGLIEKLSREVRLDILKAALSYARELPESADRERWQDRLSGDIAFIRKLRDQDICLGLGAYANEINAVIIDYGENPAFTEALEKLRKCCLSSGDLACHDTVEVPCVSGKAGEADEDTAREPAPEPELQAEAQPVGEQEVAPAESAADREHVAEAQPAEEPGQDEEPEQAEEEAFCDPLEVFSTAVESLSSFSGEHDKAGALAALAAVLAEYGHKTWTRVAFDQLLTCIVSLQSQQERQRAVVAVTRLITGKYRDEGWRGMFERLGGVLETVEGIHLRVSGWVWLALARYQARDYRGARDTLNRCIPLAFHCEEPREMVHSLCLLSSCAVAVGLHSKARALAFHALQICEAPADKRIDAETKSALVLGVSANVSEERSLAYLESSVKAAQEIPDLRVKASLLSALAGGLFDLGEEERAYSVFGSSLAVSRSMYPGALQARLLADQAVQEWQWGHVSKADRVIAEAERSARSDSNISYCRLALLDIASNLRAIGDEAGARRLLDEVFAGLETLSGTALAKGQELTKLARLVCTPVDGAPSLSGRLNRVSALLKKASKSLRSLKGRERDEAHLRLASCRMALGDAEGAYAEVTAIAAPDLRMQGRVALAKSFIKERPEEALDLLSRVEIFSERMRGIKECTVELLRDTTRSRRKEVLDILAELTLLAMDDEATADVLVGRWVNLETNRKAIVDSLDKLGYSLEEIKAGKLGTACPGE